jgi:TPR repeat protein
MRTRTILLWWALFAVVGAVVVLFLLPLSQDVSEPVVAQIEAPLSPATAADTCLRLSGDSTGFLDLDAEAQQRQRELRRASCAMALAAEPENTRWKVAVGRAMPYQHKAQAVALFREAAAQDDAEACYELYSHHNSWERGDLDKVPLVTRAEAEHSLRKGAELGHPRSMQMLAILLDRGTTVKRDAAAARYWAERAAANPAKDESLGNLMVLLGRLLAASDNPEERSRGLDILEKRAPTPQYGAKTELANAIRKQDPVRARGLLEEARSRDPGGATPPLAEMLLAGEGGPADPKRALSLLKANANGAAVAGVLGRLYLEGKLVPRDVQEAVRLIGQAGAWDLDARIEELRLLAAHPEVRDRNPKHTLYYAAEAAELDEPGAMAALIELKLSENPQFQDKPGACKLIETAVKRGDQAMAQRLAACRAN